MAKIQRLLGELKAAQETQEALLKELAESGESDGYVHEELGECYLAGKRAEEARAQFRKAYEILSKDDWEKANEPDHLARLKSLAGLD